MAMKKTDFEQLSGILDQFDTDTVLAVLKSRLGLAAHVGGSLVIPPIVVYPGGVGAAEVMAQDKSTDCGPKKTSATKWGEWNDYENEADKSARTKAREAAAAGCGGNCPREKTCKYKEESHELLETETREKEVTRAPEYRTKARSTGACQCE